MPQSVDFIFKTVCDNMVHLKHCQVYIALLHTLTYICVRELRVKSVSLFRFCI